MAPLKQLYIFRHGETDWNREEKFQGHIDIPLNNQGCEQARLLIKPLRQLGIEAMISSDLSRAQETAQIIADELKIQVYKDKGLREAYLGHAQGLTRTQIETQFGGELAKRWRSSHVSDADVCYPDGETGLQVMNRAFKTLEDFLNSNAYKKIGVSTHGGVIRRMMQQILVPQNQFIPIPNGILYPLNYNSDQKKWGIETFLPFFVPP